MNVLLIRPNFQGQTMAKVMPLGLLAIGSVLKREGHHVRILDLRVSDCPDTDLKNAMTEFRPDVAGVGLMTIESDFAFATAAKIKTLNKDIPVVFGGPHCAHEPRFILHDPNVDFMVIGEGERTIVELLQALRRQGNLDAVHGIAYRKNGEYVKTPAREPIQEQDSLKQEYELLDVERYFKFQSSHDFLPSTSRFMPILTSRGCPFTCTYCHDIFGKSIRYRSPGAVLEEMRFLKETYGVREFQILDDSFNIDMKRAKHIFSQIAQQRWDVKISFPNGLRADYIDAEMVQKMKEAGVYRLALGIESGSLKIQKQISKSLDIGILKDVVRMISSAGISVHGFFMLGFPGESKEEMRRTIDFACELDLSTANFSLVIPNPGTRLRAEVLEEGEAANRDFSQYSITDVNSNASQATSEELIALRRLAYRKFYFNLKRAWNIIQTTQSKTLLLRKFLSLLKLTNSWPHRLSYQS